MSLHLGHCSTTALQFACAGCVVYIHVTTSTEMGKVLNVAFAIFRFFPSGLMLTHLFSSGPLLTQAQERFKIWGPMWPRGSIWPGVKMRVLCGTLTCGGDA